jgi:hypothetical protein
VTRLHESEHFRLEVGAHIAGFLPVMAIRKSREMRQLPKAAMPIIV